MNIVIAEGMPPSRPPAPPIQCPEPATPSAGSPRNRLFVSLVLALVGVLAAKKRHLAMPVAVEVMKHLQPREAVRAARTILVRVPGDARKAIGEVVRERQKIRAGRSNVTNFADPYRSPGLLRLAIRRHQLSSFRQQRHWLWVWNSAAEGTD